MDIDKIPDLGELPENVRPLFEVAERYRPSTVMFPSSISSFDNVMDGGFRGGELVVVSGETGRGKTAFCQYLTACLDRGGVPSLWFSYECNPWYLKDKFIQMGCDGSLLAYSPIEMTASTLRFVDERTDEAIKHYGCRAVFIDHLHYLIPLDQSTNASLMIGGVMRELKKMAVKKDITIFLIAHTKKIYQDEKLDLSSLRDSSFISQESDYVLLVERLKKDSGAKLEMSGTEWTNLSRVSVAKNRRTGKLIYTTFEFIDNKFIEVREDDEIIRASHDTPSGFRYEFGGGNYDHPIEV